MKRILELEKPVYTVGVVAEMLGSPARTLLLYDELLAAARSTAAIAKWRFTLRDVLALRAVARLRRRYEMNCAGARQMIRCLQLLDAHHIPRPTELRGFDLEYVSI
jgi:DNA-binding transcriptional MerR regulator